MATERRRSLARAAIVTLWIVGACASEDSHQHTSGIRTLDNACSAPEQCKTTGAVARVEGITADSIAYRLVGMGRLVVPLSVADAYTGNSVSSYTVSALVAGRGPVSIRHVAGEDAPATSANHMATDDYEWKAAIRGSDGKLLIIEGTDPTTDVTIADVRIQVLDDEYNCSTAAPGRPRPHSLFTSSIARLWALIRQGISPIGSGTNSNP